MKKRLLAMLMVLMLVVSLLPVGALAAGDGEYDIVRLMDRSEWSEAVHARAGVEVGSAVSIQRIFVYDANHNQMNTGAASGLLTPDCYYADTYDVSEEDIQTIVVILTSDGKTISAVFDTEDFEVTDTGGVAATKHIQLTLTERGKGRPSGHQVNFYAELNNETTYSLYDTIYVQDGQQIGDQMPNDPPVGSYVFLGWQTEEDGGISVDRNTYVYSDMNVYAAKGTSGTGHAQEYHVMGSTDKRSNALAIEVADHYNSANNTDYGVESFTIEDISVNGTASNTNPIYAENEWKDEGSYYYVYNVSRDPVEVIPENHNDRVEVADITGITVYGKLNGSDYSQFIPVSELSITEVQNNVVVELRVREKLDGVTKELVTTSDVSAPSVEGVTIPDIGETVAVPENGSVTLMYKISVFGDAGAAYNVTDENATVVNGDSLQGTIDSSRVAVIYVTKTFTADDITNGCLTNNATVVPGDNSTLGTDDGDNDAEAIVDAEVDDDPQPEEPRNPTEDDLSKLAVVLECINEDVPHTEDPKTFNLETAICTYDIEQSGEQYICFVMPDYDKILDTYNEQVAGGHTYADEVGKAFTLVWTGEAWDNGDAEPITCQVKCETPEQPTMYKIHVTVHNGTATFCGSEVTSHILAAENEDITITFTPDEGYTLDYATIDGDMLQIPDDGVYTLKLVGSDHTIEVFYAEDKLGGGDDGTEPDGTPDYRQVFVKYVAADENGVVTPTFDTFNLEVDEIGKVMTDDALSLSGMATPNADATFAYWTIEGLGYDGGAYSYEADLSGKGFTGYVAGETYTFTAYFNGPVVKPEQPDVYKIHVTVHNGTATFCGSEVTSHILAAENEDITITFTPDEGYTLDYATIDGDMLQIPDDGVYTLKLVGSDHTIEVFYAEDKLGGGDDGTEPDGTPDYRQVFVKYVAADENGVVTPTFDTFNLEVDEIGKVMTDDALSLSGMATPNADATFAYWTIEGLGYDGGAYSYEADLSGKGFTGYVAGETYTFTAYFNGPVVKPEQPDVYKIHVTVHNGTATFCGSEVTSHILAAENEDITITFTPNEGYTLDYATIDGNMLLIPDGGVYTLKQVDKDHTIEVFYESDKIGTEDPSEGDGVPDKYQATVNLVAGENGEVTGEMTKVYTIFDADGNYAEEGVITPSLEGVTVTPDEGYKVDGWTNAAGERVNPESEITVEGGDVVVFTVNFQSDPSLKVITSFEKKLVTDRKTYHSFGLRVPTFIRNGSTVVVDEGKCVTLLYAISLTGTPGAEYAITDTGADVAGGNALTGEIPETGVVTVYVTKDFTWREAAAAAYKDDALVNTAAVELTDNPNEPGQESTEEVDVVIDWDDPNVPVVPSDPDDEDEDDEVFVPKWLNTEDHFAYIVGYEDGTIKPENNITRAEVATIFFRLLTDDARARFWSSENDYTDVATDSWYNNAVSTLSNMGIINGYEDGTFQPNASITRAEFTAIATRFFDYTAEYDGAFNDVASGSWYADYVQAAVDMGLVDGYPDGGFHPNSYITRAEAVTIVNRVLNRVPHEDYLLSTRVMNTWPDNVYGAWYYADMQEATNSHDYDWIRVSGERVEEWTEKLTERDWAALEQQWSTAYSG